MSKSLKVTMFTIVFLLVFASFALLADDTGLEACSGSPAETPKKFVRESDLRGMRGVLWSQIPDTINANGYACQLDSVFPFDADLCDDIMPTGDGWIIDSVTTWWANWNGYTSWDSVRYMRFLVYRDDTANSPRPVDSAFIDMVVPDSNCTAAEFGSLRCRVDMKLPVSVQLPPDTIFWIEVQPVNLYSLNGQTGWMSGTGGIGDGIGWHMRFPYIGYSTWISAAVYGIDSLEVAMVLRGDLVSGIPEDNSESLFLSVNQLPSTEQAMISYSINKSGPATLKIYDLLGKKVKTLVDAENASLGVKTVYWDYKNDNGTSAVNGVYMVRLESDNKAATQKLILAR